MADYKTMYFKLLNQSLSTLDSLRDMCRICNDIEVIKIADKAMEELMQCHIECEEIYMED